MIQDRIAKIEAVVSEAKTLPPVARAELLELLTELKGEVASLGKTHGEDVESITRFADASVHEATRAEQKPALVEAALKGLSHSVKDFEVSHPRLVQVVDRIALTLSNMGI